MQAVRERMQARVALVAVLLAGAAIVLAPQVADVSTHLEPLNPLRFVPRYANRLQDNVLLNPVFIPAVLGLVLLERRWPARPRTSSLRSAMLVDALWMLGHLLFELVVIVVWLDVLKGVYTHLLGGWRPDSVAAWSPAVGFVVAVLVKDFVEYWHHVIRHKVAVFWYFHAVHHSQDELNLFSKDRIHGVEYLIAHALAFAPFFVFRVDLHLVVGFYVVELWYHRFFHTNVRTNLGPLRYLLVTPQSHRIHHSADPRHWEKNFGVNFTLWDQLFGTQYRGWDEYPETGIDDPDFPLRRGAGLAGAVRAYGAQLAYPFRQVARRWAGTTTRVG